MSLLSDSLPTLFGGVSQQSPLVRAKDQLEVMANGWASLAEGLKKRAPTETIAKIMNSASANAHTHEINRDVTENYVVIAADGAIRVFDTFTGAEKTVTAPGGWGYLSGATDYSTDIEMFTVADYTFVINKKKVCAMAAVGADATAQPNYYAWPNTTIGTDASSTDFGPGLPFQYKPNPNSNPMSGEVQRFDKLPPQKSNGSDTPPEGAIYKVTGDPSQLFIAYWVRYTGGVWNETVKPGLKNALDATTMPHALVRQGDGTFKFVPFSWAPRRVLDDVTNPNPKFIGRTISKAFLYQNRLAFLTDEHVVFSCAGDLGNFWRNESLDYLDGDVISVAASTTKVSILYDAATFNDGILLTSDQLQFSLSNGEAGVTPASLAIRPTTAYTVNTQAGLCPIGSEVYFAVERNGYAAIREYQRLSGSDATAAADVTAHIPSYIPAGVHKLIGADDMNALFVLTNGKPQSIYVYQFYWLSDTEKAQSAWHEWDFGEGATIVSGAYVRGYLYLTVSRADGLYLERIDLGAAARPTQTDNQVYLDRRTAITGTFNSGTNKTTFTVPYVANQSAFRLVRSNAFTSKPESLIDPTTYTWVNSTTVQVPGNETAGAVVAGEVYTMTVQFSQQVLRKPDGAAITTGRLTLRTFTVSYRETAYFKTIVAPYGTDPKTEEVLPAKIGEFTGKVLGAGDLILNQPLYHTGRYPFQVYGDATQATIKLVNDTHVGSTFVAAEWEATYWNRSRV